MWYKIREKPILVSEEVLSPNKYKNCLFEPELNDKCEVMNQVTILYQYRADRS